MKLKIKLIYLIPFATKCIHGSFSNMNHIFDDRKSSFLIVPLIRLSLSCQRKILF
jgi:hypothetical protein